MQRVDSFGNIITPYQNALIELEAIGKKHYQYSTQDLLELEAQARLGAQKIKDVDNINYIYYSGEDVKTLCEVAAENAKVRAFKNYVLNATIDKVFATEHQTGKGLLMNVENGIPCQTVLVTAAIVVSSKLKHPQEQDIQGFLDVFSVCLLKIASSENAEFIHQTTIVAETALTSLCKILCNYPSE